jgi:acylglycerol lipase
MPPTDMSNVTTSSEGTFTTDDGVCLYTKTWSPTNTPVVARLVFVHGFSDHINCYGILFPTLAAQGIAVHAYDQRGWGRSVRKPSDKGNTGPTTRILDDLTNFIESLPTPKNEEAQTGTISQPPQEAASTTRTTTTTAPHPAGPPLFLMGHSMGGGIILTYASQGPTTTRRRIRGYLAAAPYVALHAASQPWWSTVVLGQLAGKLFPHNQLVRVLDAAKLSRDPGVGAAWAADPLCHDTGTLESLAAMLERGRVLERGRAGRLEGEAGRARLWVGFGTGDRVLSWEAARRWVDGLAPDEVEDKTLRLYEGWFHMLHAEPGEDKWTFAKDVSAWILDRSGEGGGGGASRSKL